MAVRQLDFKYGVENISAKATVAITGNPTAPGDGGGLLVDLDTDPNFFVLAGVGSDPLGIVDENVLINSAATIHMDGILKVRLGGTVVKLDYLEAFTGGKAVKATGLRPIVGRTLMAGVSGDFVSVIRSSRTNGPIYGADVASAAALVPTGNVFHVTGTTTVTSITSTGILAGSRITIIFDGVLTFTDGSNLKLAGDFTTSAADSITLVYDGTNWHEVARSAN